VLVGDLNATAGRLDHCEAVAFDYLSDGDERDKDRPYRGGDEEGGSVPGGKDRCRLQQHTFESRPAAVWMRSLCGNGQDKDKGPVPRLPSKFTSILDPYVLSLSNRDGSGDGDAGGGNPYSTSSCVTGGLDGVDDCFDYEICDGSAAASDGGDRRGQEWPAGKCQEASGGREERVARWLLQLTGVKCDLLDTFRLFHPSVSELQTTYHNHASVL
jgi:hypothetical protein